MNGHTQMEDLKSRLGHLAAVTGICFADGARPLFGIAFSRVEA